MNAQLLNDIIEHLPIGIIVLDPEGRVILMNRWQEKISRIRRENVIGELFHVKWSRLFSQGIMDGYWDLLNHHKPFDVTVHEILPQFYDQKISAISRAVPLPGGRGFILLHDVSEEMKRDKRGIERLKDKLSEAHNFLINLIDCSPNILITVGLTERIRSINMTGVKEFGYSERELLGKPVVSLLSDASQFEQLMAPDLDDLRSEVLCVRKEGSTFPARIQVRNVQTKNGKFQAKLILLSDITWEKQMEGKLALSQKLAAYSELMAGIGHQINNPLVGVVNFSSLLLEKIDPQDETRELVETIHSAAQQCRDMLASLIKGVREPRSFFNELQLADILADALTAAIDQEPEAAAICRTKLETFGDLGGVKGDYLQMVETFRNLAVNAFQAMPDGGKIRIEARKDPAAGIVEIRVSDSGPGISETDRSRVFDPFFSTKKGKGTGLGLSFAFQVIKSHGGRIDCLSSECGGAVFRIELPCIEEERKT